MRIILFFLSIMLVSIMNSVVTQRAFAEQSSIVGFSTIPTNPYIVDDLPISVDAADAVKARELAFEQALQTGFTIIMERLYPDDQIRAKIKPPTTPDLGKMLQDFTTHDEHVGAKQYTATFQLRFRPGRVQKYLQSSGAGPSVAVASTSQNTPHQSPAPMASSTTQTTTPSYTSPADAPVLAAGPVIILPFLQTNQGQVLWAGSNPLRDAIVALTPTGSTLIPTGDAGDAQMIDEKSGIRSSPQGFQSLMSKYQSNRLVIVIAVPDSLNASAPATKMTLMFYGSSIANPTPVYLDSVVTSVDDITQNAALFTRAAQLINAQAPTLASRITMDAPEQELNAQSVSAPVDGLANTELPETTVPVTTVPTTTLPNNTLIVSSGTIEGESDAQPQQQVPISLTTEKGLSVLVRFNTMTEWNDIRTRLKSIPGITSIQIQKLKAQEATISLPALAMTSSVLNAAMTSRGLNLAPNDMMVFDQSGNAPAFVLTRVSPLPSTSLSSSSDLSVSSAPLNQSRTSLDGR